MAEAMGNVHKLGDGVGGDECAKKAPSIVVIEEIQKEDKATTLQSPVATGFLQRCFVTKGTRRGKIIFWLYVVGFAGMLLILVLLAAVLGVRAKESSSSSHAGSTSSHAGSSSGHTKLVSTHTKSTITGHPSSTSGYGSPTSTQSGITCTVTPAANGADSAAVIRKAFKSCGRAKAGQRNRIVFENTTYTIASVLETTNLQNVDIELHGTLSWDNSDLDYWLNHSLVVGYQNQSTAWRLGGDSITFNGYGTGTFNGNGDAWYRFINGRSNYPGRPHQLTITDTTNSTFEGLSFLQSQMWTMTVIHSSDVLLQDIYVNNTSKTGAPTVNTDGCDTIYANNITFRRWVVDNGDDGISPKANSTNILIEDSEFYRGSGIALGSIGQMHDQFETIENVTCRNITAHNTKNGAYIKTWTGVTKGYPPNGGGGGFGYAQNLVFENFKLINVQKAFTITQCTNFEGNKGDCDTSKFNIRDVYLSNFTGTVRGGIVTTMQCSAAAPCRDIHISNFALENSSNHTTPGQYQCDSVKDTVGFLCTGPPDGEDNAFKK